MTNDQIEVKRMKLGGPAAREDAPRGVKRIIVEVDCETESHVICGHRLSRGVQRFEAYADEWDKIQRKTQTQEHRDAWKAAEKIVANQSAQWLRDNGIDELDTEEAREDLRRRCPVSIAEALGTLGLKTGMPPFRYSKKIEDLDAPPTAENIAAKANDRLAEAIAKALGGRKG